MKEKNVFSLHFSRFSVTLQAVMSTIIYPSPVFGPVRSRRLGISLGINLLPEGGKWCSFDCIYCECGFNADHRTHNPLPSPEQVEAVLTAKLEEMKAEGLTPDVLTFAGNGEPTLHPQFPEIVHSVLKVRDINCPSAKLSILSNGTQIHRPEIRQALLLFDNNIQKLDTVSQEYIERVDRPQGAYDVEKKIQELKEFHGHVIIQTMFMKGEFEGRSVSNIDEEAFVTPYLSAIKKIQPQSVMVYTIDRETPAHGLQKAAPEELDAIADKIRALGIPCSVSY